MKKLLCLFLALCCAVSCLTLPAFAQEDDGEEAAAAPSTGVTINVYNWGEYISDGADDTLDVNEEFTRRTGIAVNYTTFATNEELYAKLAIGGSDYDIIVPSDYMVAKLIKNDMLEKLDFSNIPNFELIDENFRNPQYDPTNAYSVPYTWGTVGIFYNKSMVDESEDEIGWDILWDPKYAGQILMFDNSRDAFGISQVRLGLDFNTTDPSDWYAAADDLMKQKPLVQSYVMDQIFNKMGNNEAALAPYYAGDAAIILEENEDVGFVIPKEGTNLFVDAMCIPKGSRHKAEAEAYINFMCDVEIATANIEYIGYSTPESAVRENLDPEVAESPIFYPSEEVLANTQVFTDLPDDVNLLIDDLWVQVKTGGSDDTALLIAVLVGFVLLYVGVVVYKKTKERRERKGEKQK